MHTQLCQYCPFIFFQGLGQGKIIETSAKRLWYLTVFFSHCQHSPSPFRRKEAIVCSCESHWTGWALLALLKNIQGQPKVQGNNKGRCSMLTETGDRIGSKAGGDISSLFFATTSPRELRWKWSINCCSPSLQPDLVKMGFDAALFREGEKLLKIIEDQRFWIGKKSQLCLWLPRALICRDVLCPWKLGEGCLHMRKPPGISSLEALDMHMHMHWRKGVHTHQSGYQGGIIPVSACGYIATNAKKFIESYPEFQKLFTGRHKNTSWGVGSIWNLCILFLTWK